MAKRSHFCQKVIKRLKCDLKDAQLGIKSDETAFNTGGKAGTGKFTMPERDERGNEDLINFLEQKLEQHEKNLVVKQQEYDNLQTEYADLQEKFNQSR